MERNVEIIWSESWLKNDIENVTSILNETIKDFGYIQLKNERLLTTWGKPFSLELH